MKKVQIFIFSFLVLWPEIGFCDKIPNYQLRRLSAEKHCSYLEGKWSDYYDCIETFIDTEKNRILSNKIDQKAKPCSWLSGPISEIYKCIDDKILVRTGYEPYASGDRIFDNEKEFCSSIRGQAAAVCGNSEKLNKAKSSKKIKLSTKDKNFTKITSDVYSQNYPIVVALSPDEQLCMNYGYQRGSSYFGQCLMQLDQAKQQAQLAQQQYQLQLQQYQQQQAAFEAQQEAIKKERERRKWEMLARLGAGMANSRSPSFLGALNEGLAAANGVQIDQPVAPPQPPPQNYTVRLPSGTQVYCNYNAGYMSCR